MTLLGSLWGISRDITGRSMCGYHVICLCARDVCSPPRRQQIRRLTGTLIGALSVFKRAGPPRLGSFSARRPWSDSRCDSTEDRSFKASAQYLQDMQWCFVFYIGAYLAAGLRKAVMSEFVKDIKAFVWVCLPVCLSQRSLVEDFRNVNILAWNSCVY